MCQNATTDSAPAGCALQDDAKRRVGKKRELPYRGDAVRLKTKIYELLIPRKQEEMIGEKPTADLNLRKFIAICSQ